MLYITPTFKKKHNLIQGVNFKINSDNNYSVEIIPNKNASAHYDNGWCPTPSINLPGVDINNLNKEDGVIPLNFSTKQLRSFIIVKLEKFDKNEMIITTHVKKVQYNKNLDFLDEHDYYSDITFNTQELIKSENLNKEYLKSNKKIIINRDKKVVKIYNGADTLLKEFLWQDASEEMKKAYPNAILTSYSLSDFVKNIIGTNIYQLGGVIIPSDCNFFDLFNKNTDKELNYIKNLSNILENTDKIDTYYLKKANDAEVYFEKKLMNTCFSFSSTNMICCKDKIKEKLNRTYSAASSHEEEFFMQLCVFTYAYMNKGLESVMNSYYVNSLYHRITCEESFLENKISDVLNINKSTHKFIGRFMLEFKNQLSKYCNSDFTNDLMFSKCIETMTSKDNMDSLDNLIRLIGYNNTLILMQTYFDNFFDYLYMLKSIDEKNSCQYIRYNSYTKTARGVHYDSITEFEEALPNIYMSELIKTLIDNISLYFQYSYDVLERYPKYQNNILAFAKYVTTAPQKQGFQSVRAFFNQYIDYLDMQTSFSDKYEKYPTALRRSHDIAATNSYLRNNQNIYASEEFNKAVQSYDNLSYYDDDFIITTPTSYQDLFIEGASLNHCVASYIKKIENKTSKILFLRKKDNQVNPFYTIEVRNKRISQIKGLNQVNPTEPKLQQFISNWAKKKTLIEDYKDR